MTPTQFLAFLDRIGELLGAMIYVKLEKQEVTEAKTERPYGTIVAPGSTDSNEPRPGT